MSALAFYMQTLGNNVQGSDIAEGQIKEKLQKNGIKVFNKHKKENLKDVDVVVYNFAIKESNEELCEAKKRKIKIISRAQLLGIISSTYKKVISISGSHGKTSTTAMIYNCLKASNCEPTLHIGGIIEGNEFGFVKGKTDYFITEACEFHNSFLDLKSDVAVILNIEPEHLDYFKSFKNEKKSFQKFANNSKVVIAHKNCQILNATKFGNNGQIIAKNIKLNNHRYSFDCYIDGVFFVHINLGAYGKHNINNALAVIGVCKTLNINKKYIQQGLSESLKIERRFQVINNSSNLIIHDYAHHPTEIQKTIATFKEISGKKNILVVFQPHTYSRTKSLFKDFINCFINCENLLLIKSYSAREKYDKTASAFALYNVLKKHNKNISYCASFDVAKQMISKKLKQNYNVLILGAGDVEMIANSLKHFN